MELTQTERLKGQAYALRANLLNIVGSMIVIGSLMVLYANDVLGYSPKRIATILGVIPLFAVVRLFLLQHIKNYGYIRTLKISVFVRILVIIALILVPESALTFPLYLALLTTFCLSSQLGIGSVWQPLLRTITTNQDRGRFFARMRFYFTIISTVATAIIPFVIGSEITAGQYRCFLAFALLGQINFIFWVVKIPISPAAKIPIGLKYGVRRLWAVGKKSPLLRRPLFITVLGSIASFPLFIVYLKTILNMPTNIVSIFVFMMTLGSALTMLLWGKIADTLGFKPMMIGLIIISILVYPLHLLLAPLPDAGATVAMNLSQFISLGTLFLLALVKGAYMAGIGIATTSLQHYHVRNDDSLEAMAIYSIVIMLVGSAISFFSGYFLEYVAMPVGDIPLFNGILHFDLVKGYLFLCFIPIQIIIILNLRKIVNIRPCFGLGDFFSSLSVASLRNIWVQRYIFHEEENRRLATAKWFSNTPNPMAIDPLIEMTHDTSYDVKIEAIRGLATSGSPLARIHLENMLKNPAKRSLWEHVCWALGEFSHESSFECLLDKLQDDCPPRSRAMAARALGKIGNVEALPVLVEILLSDERSQHVKSSACLALIQLGGEMHAAIIFSCLSELTNRDDRFELIPLLCSYLDITNEWFLKNVPKVGSSKALLGYAEKFSKEWQEKNREVLDALKNRDISAIVQIFENELSHVAAGSDRTVLEGLGSSLHIHPQWQPTASLAAAWLLLHK